MLMIYTAPISSAKNKTLQAKGQVWEELARRLTEQKKEYLLELLLAQLPPTFGREQSIRLTFTIKNADQLLRIAGVSV